jgi:hypothetical protein
MIRGELEKYRRIGWVAFGMIFGWDLLLRKVIHFLIMNFNKLLNIQINGFLNMCLSNQLSKFKYIEGISISYVVKFGEGLKTN